MSKRLKFPWMLRSSSRPSRPSASAKEMSRQPDGASTMTVCPGPMTTLSAGPGTMPPSHVPGSLQFPPRAEWTDGGGGTMAKGTE